MNRTIFAKSVARRTMLAGAGAGVLGLLLRPLQAQEAKGPPKRILIVHRPCGTVLEKFFPPAGDAHNFTLPSIISSFEPLKNDMVILNGVNCSRDPNWPADKHAAALIAMMGGKKFVEIPGTDAAGDPNAKNIVAPDATIDQWLLNKVPDLQGTPIPSIQSTAYAPSTGGLPSFKVMSYKGNNLALFPEVDAKGLFQRIFVGDNAGLSPEEIARKVDQNKSVLDRVHADLTRLQGLIPASQKPKLDAHLSAIQGLELALQNSGNTPGKMCTPPSQVALPTPMNGATQAEAEHLALAQNHLSIIQTAFQCDLTRVATFTFAHGNSDLRFQKIDDKVDKGDGHHGVSHDTSAALAQERIDQIYSEQLSLALQKWKATPEGTGSLLDNTLVVFFNECAIGNTHSIENMPMLMLGGKNLGLQTGQHLQFTNKWTNDMWAAVCGAFKLEASFGDKAFASSPLNGLFA
ncbi:MAG TPA: DUF1552 domain-containing protein [Polyangiaceae bacterium]|nr:DUF1552 domain-containing protein [Polyangiaceae bacterium]